MTNTPDTSPANVAKMLRLAPVNVARVLRGLYDRVPCPHKCTHAYCAMRHTAFALADALEHQIATPWSERVERLARHLESTSIRIHGGDNWEDRNRAEYDKRAAAALRAAFPELAPSDD